MHRSFTTTAACFTLAATLGACAADNGDEGIFISKNVAASDSCGFAADEAAPFLAHGTFSVFSPMGYGFHPLLKSRIASSAAQEIQRTVLLRGARVNLRFADEKVLSAAQQESLRTSGVMRFTALFTAPLAPNGGLADGEFDIIPTTLLDQIVMAKGAGILAKDAPSFRAELIADITVFGDMSGEEVKSQPFQYAVTICNDCVAKEVGPCPLPVGTVPRKGNACNPYQDGVSDCCRVNPTELQCPATVAVPPPA